MTTIVEQWQTAWLIVEQYGAEGIGFAAEMARNFEQGGKRDVQQEWLAIQAKIETLTAMDQSSGALMH